MDNQIPYRLRFEVTGLKNAVTLNCIYWILLWLEVVFNFIFRKAARACLHNPVGSRRVLKLWAGTKIIFFSATKPLCIWCNMANPALGLRKTNYMLSARTKKVGFYVSSCEWIRDGGGGLKPLYILFDLFFIKSENKVYNGIAVVGQIENRY